MTTYSDLSEAHPDDEVHVQVRLEGPDAWSHHPITGVQVLEQSDGSRRLILVSDPPPDTEPAPPAVE